MCSKLEYFPCIAKCFIPCMNDGKCININKCRCPHGFGGDHCEIDNRQQSSVKCKRPCRNGTCMANRQCRCKKGWIGRFCNKRGKQSIHRRKLDCISCSMKNVTLFTSFQQETTDISSKGRFADEQNPHASSPKLSLLYFIHSNDKPILILRNELLFDTLEQG